MSQSDDGTFECARCKTALNITDKLCWRCGSTDIRDMRPLPALNDCDGFVPQPFPFQALIGADKLLSALPSGVNTDSFLRSTHNRATAGVNIDSFLRGSHFRSTGEYPTSVGAWKPRL